MALDHLDQHSGSQGSATASPSRWWTLLLATLFMALNRAKRQSTADPTCGSGRARPGTGCGTHSRGPAAEQKVTAERDRGRLAQKPSEIPAKGWKDIFWRVYDRFSRDRMLLVAAGVTFYALLAFFPAIAALVSLYGLFADPSTVSKHLEALSGILPGGAMDLIGDQVKRITAKGRSTLGLAFFSGLAVSLWSANAGMKAMFDALNIAYEEDEKRSFVALTLQSLGFTLGALVFILVTLGAVVALPVVLRVLPFGNIVEWLLSILRWPILYGIAVVCLACLYRYGPSREKAQWRWLTWGSAFAATIWLVGSILFSWYVANFGSYNETYGSLGAAVGFMTWVWLSIAVVLVGAEINAEMEHQTVRDTTIRPEKPLGARGARMADTVGEVKS
jgi:membrane protein